MADTKISALTSGNPAQSGDEIPIARAGANYKITAGSIASLATVSPAGSDTYVQFNDGGAFGAEAGFAYNKTTNTLSSEKLALGTAGAAAGVLTLSGSTSGTVTLQPAAAAGTYSLTLPTSDGNSGEVLTTDGSGVLSWAAGGGAPGGSNTQLQYNNAGAFGGTSGITTTGTELTIASGTKTASTPVLDITQTWNNAAVTFTALKTNVTDTASNSESLLADFQVAGTSKVAVRKNGTVRLINTANGNSAFVDNDKAIEFGAEGSATYSALVAGQYGVLYHVAATPTSAGAGIRSGSFVANGAGSGGETSGNNTGVARIGSLVGAFGLGLISSGVIRWSSGTTDAYSADDITLARDAANTLAQRNGTNAQTLRVYGTYTSSTSYERVDLKSSSSVFYLQPEKGSGGGTLRPLVVGHGATTYSQLPAAAAALEGARAYVSDWTGAATFGTTVNAGGGSTKVPVWCDGTNWLVG